MTDASQACPGPSPRVSLRARLLLWVYRWILRPVLSSKTLGLDRARRVAAMLDRWLGAGRAAFERVPVSANGVAAEWVKVDRDLPRCVILYLHGGGFMLRTPRLHARLVARLCRSLHAQALVPDYRLAPEHALPAAHEDCLAAYRWVLEQGFDPARIVLIGDSAGGLLVLAVLQRIRDAGLPRPACGVMFSPGTDFDGVSKLDANSTRGDPMISAGAIDLIQRIVIAAIDPCDPAISPCAGNLGGLPPLLFQAGSTEVLLEQSRQAFQQARAAGTAAELQVWPRMPHVWQAVRWLPEARQALACVNTFVAQQLAEVPRESASAGQR